ncbi:MAG: exodeoxyribonuclease VII large subunit [Casimicrobiaceae bacterium]
MPVSALVSSARLLLERHLGLAWISGEVSNFTRAASGHCYFNLKDAKAQVRCVFFRNKAQFIRFALKDGVQVELRATPTIYEARGEFQLNVETMRQAGIGQLYERFAELKARMEAAGWFRSERKRPLPGHPARIGIVTSLAAAALRDVLTTLRRRLPSLAVIIYPAAVQGASAAGELAAAIATANGRAEVDVLIVCRGGGSIEDLWPFNEEIVARAIFLSTLPVVSGVGHETDFTIADFVADARAPTPTAAAILVAPDGAALRRALAVHARRWSGGAARGLETRMQRLDAAARRLVHPAARLALQERTLADLARRLARCHAHRVRAWDERLVRAQRAFAWRLARPLAQCAAVEQARELFLRGSRTRLDSLGRRVAVLEQSLQHLGPAAVLARGYAIVARADGRIVTETTEVALGDDVKLTFARGSASARITGK